MSVEYVPKRYNQSLIDSIPNTGTEPIIVAVLDTGVDPMAYGLQQCPDGTPKVIDVIDCTGSDIVKMSETKFDLVPTSVRKIMNCVDDTLTIFTGTRYLETFFSDTKYDELNEEQKKVVDDVVLNVYTYKRDGIFRVLIEDYSDDELVDYNINYQCGKIIVGSVCFYFAVHVYKNGKEVSLVFDSGTHGTHIAAIIGGYFPDKPEQNGINPNARILSLKTGNTESPEALCRALDEMVKYKCTLANYSFGEIIIPTDVNCGGMTGRFIEKLNQYVEKYNIVFVTSACNYGPHLMTIGAPGICTENCIVVGAYTDQKMLNDLYFQNNNFTCGPYYWSSCGPKYNKSSGVDMLAPGCALSSYPHWYKTNMKFCDGTSMACPNAVGIMSLVLEKHTNCARDIPFYWIKKYFENSCYAMPNIDSFAQGNGLIMGANVETMGKGQIQSYPYHYEVTNSLNPAHNGSFIHIKHECDTKQPSNFYNVCIKIVPKFKNSLDTSTFRKILHLKADFGPIINFSINSPTTCIVDSQGSTIRVQLVIDSIYWNNKSNLSGYIKFIDPDTNMFVASYHILAVVSKKIKNRCKTNIKISAGVICRQYCRFTKNTVIIRTGKNNSLNIGIKDLTEFHQKSNLYNISKTHKDQFMRFNCIPYALYEIIIYLPWDAETDIPLKLTNYATTISISKPLMLIGESTSISITYSKNKDRYEKPFVPMVSHITSHYLPISATITGEKLILLYNLQLHKGCNKYYVDSCEKVYNAKVASGPNLFGLSGGKIMFMGNYKHNKYEGILDQVIIEFVDEDTKILEEYKQLVLCVERQPKKLIDNISKVLPIEDGFMIDLCLTKSMLAEETIYYDDFIHCKLRNTSDEIITYVNKTRSPVQARKKPQKSVHTFCNKPMIQLAIAFVLVIGIGKIVKVI